MTILDSMLKSRGITLPKKVHLVKTMVFPVVTYGCESWTIKKVERWRIDAFELWCWRRLLRVPWTGTLKPVNSKGNQSWIFIDRTDAEADTTVLWPPDAKSWFTGKDPDLGKIEHRRRRGLTEDEMVGWHHKLNGHGFGLTPGVGDGQGGLACCSSWGHKELDTTERLNWTELNHGVQKEHRVGSMTIKQWSIFKTFSNTKAILLRGHTLTLLFSS